VVVITSARIYLLLAGSVCKGYWLTARGESRRRP
jgi:hypothetical protein